MHLIAVGKEGLEAKNTEAKKSAVDQASLAMSRMTLGGSKRTKKTTFTMYSCSGSVKSSKSMKTTANFSFAGKSCANDGTVKGSAGNGFEKPVISTTLDKAIAAGVLSFGQVDHWGDDQLNKRASTHLMLTNGTCLNALSCRKSETDQKVLVLLLGISTNFTDLDKKLEHLIPLIMHQLDCEAEVARKFLNTHPRTLAAKKNLQKLAGSGNIEALENGEVLLAEVRIKYEFEVAEDLVTTGEDPVVHGWTMKGPDKESDEYHFYFELKERGKTFKPVTYNASSAKKKSTPQLKRNKKSMFGYGMPSDPGMPSLPEEVSFKSPSRIDDASTICSAEQASRLGSKQGDPMEEDSSDSSFDSNCADSWDDWDDETEEDSEKLRMADQLKLQEMKIAGLIKQQEEMMRTMSGAAGLQRSKSQDSEESGNNSPPKKKKGSKGKARATSSIQSGSSRITRGSIDREAKRKQNEKGKKE